MVNPFQYVHKIEEILRSHVF